MYSKLLLASSLVASVLGTSWGSSDQSCCNNGGWADWQQGQQSQVVVQIVSVSDANGSLKYYPDNIKAAPGTVVQFQFHPKVSSTSRI
jgi:plastocyanin